MLTYQVHKFRGGYTLVELLVVILIIGLFFYLVVPSMKNILPEEENEKILKLVDFIEKISRDAIEQKQKIIFTVDIDTNSCSFITEKEMEENSQESEEDISNNEEKEEASSSVTFPLDFIKAQNSSVEASSGLITILFFPDGSKEFGTILVEDVDSGDIYTIFLNPYTISPEVIKGEARFEEGYNL
ncbi:MAG: type II secretion system protein [Candidatus Ratteibacteria bacterium]|nr:type II secretion system protein [Candidatus Ratteibacteria bacterium]